MKPAARSQLLDLFLHVAAELGVSSDRDLARLAEVSVDNIAHWKSGASRELKTQTLETIKRNLGSRVAMLRQQVRWMDWSADSALIPMEVEASSDPAALQRQFIDRMVYDYLGHRFLYFEPQGALAWEKLIGSGYQQDCWLKGVETCLQTWLGEPTGPGSEQGLLTAALGLAGRSTMRSLDLVSLGPGEGSKEAVVLGKLLGAQASHGVALPQLTLALVDVSIPLLLKAARASKRVPVPEDVAAPVVLPVCGDFEEGSLDFLTRLPSSVATFAGSRLVLILGNVFGNLRDEDRFLQNELSRMVRSGDLVWLEVGLRPENLESDPLFAVTRPDFAETPSFTNRRLLLEGPYRRWEAALGRRPSDIDTRITLHEGDDTSTIPGSVNFCHDLLIKEGRRVCTMLYSRRYQVEPLRRWLGARGYDVLSTLPVADHSGRNAVTHLLARRR